MLQRNKDGLYECAICHEVAYDNVRALSSHIGKHHHRDAKTYYDTYVKKDGEENCPICGHPLKFRSLSDGYRETCSKKCAGQMLKLHPERIAARQAKTEATCMEKYGTTNGGGTKDALEKAQQTNLARRGVRFAMQSKEVQETAKQTYLKEYGATTYLHSKDGEKAVAETNMNKFNRPNFFSGEEGNRAAREAYQAKHGYDHNMHDPKVIEKRKVDEFAKHDGKYFVQTDEFKQKSKETQEAEYGTWYSASETGKAKLRDQMVAEHGVEYFFQSEQFKKSNEATLMAKYNVKNYSQTPMWREQVQSTSLAKWNAEHYTKSQLYKIDAIKKYDGVLANFGCKITKMYTKNEIEFHCDKCNSVCIEQYQFIVWRASHNITPCTHCMPKNPPVSAEELAVKSYIENLGHVVTHYDRDFLGTYGADIVVEDCKTIVEYDGIYWHSELFHDSKYHLRKKMLAEEKGYRLVHIFSDEWTYKNDIVKSRLRYMFGIASVGKVYARDCTVRLVESVVSADFLDRNHIQGNVNAPYRYGLYSGDKLVALMTFGSSRFETGVTELLRFCSDRDINVVGGAGKLFSHFVKDHPEIKHIVSYADARWSTGHAFYEKLGFDFTAMSEPGYFIVDGDIRKSRMQFQRHKIAGLGDEGKTEHEITLERGLFRIYDCGQYRYDWKVESRLEKS